VSRPDADNERLLAQLREELLRDAPAPSADRIARVRAQADDQRREAVLAAAPAPRRRAGWAMPRRGFLLGGLAAASGGAAVALGVREALDGDPAPGPPTEPIALTGASDGVHASAELINHTWGVELLLTVSGLVPGRRYEAVYRATDGRELPAGSFVGTEIEALCRMNGALLRADLDAIEIREPGGEPVLRSRLA
jgi:hypothetical protein